MTPSVDALAARIAGGEAEFSIVGAPPGHDAALAMLALRTMKGPLVYVARDETQAATFAKAARFFAPMAEQLRFPAWDCVPYDRVSPAPLIAAQRCAALVTLARRSSEAPVLVITTAAAFMQRLAPRARMKTASFEARSGGDLDAGALNGYLAANGYARASTVREPGEFAVRGGVIDIFPAGAPEPIRLDLFGDTLESIRAFDPETQRTTKQLQSVMLAPACEALLDDDAVSRFRRGFVHAFGAATNGDAIYDSVTARVRKQGVEHLLPLFYERLETLADYVGPSAVFLFDHLAIASARDQFNGAKDYFEARAQASREKGASPLRALPPERLYLDTLELDSLVLGLRTRTIAPFADEKTPAFSDARGRAGRNFAPERVDPNANVFESLKLHLESRVKEGKRALIACWSDGSAERLAHVLADHKLTDLPVVSHWKAQTSARDAIQLAVLPLEQGYETSDLVVVSEQDILGDRMARQRRRRKASSLLMEASALIQGDLIVHVDHGIGRYEGLKTLDVAGAPHDCLELIYAGGDKIYLPVENIELVSRYGAEDAAAQLDKLGGVSWQNRKARAKKKLLEIAEGLIRTAAERALRSTEALPPPTGAFDEFCARFPYEETDDQLNAISDILTDLESGKPMDRLICGDVGFGKTEVALRAAFVAAMSGRQVVVAAPTTLLCRQHFRTFAERFRGLPVVVRQLSRLVPAKEVAETKQGLRDGTVDIVVGTHAVVAKDVAFRDLALIIVDEEQHFGVKHKERLKELKSEVHVLTLTATPIPRTLQLALAGIREMSVIATPPIDRLAVKTYVAEFDAVSVREALLRERYRGGQSFFVTPRIADLEDLAKFLRENVPEVSFVVAHGQMSPSQLEDIIGSFYEGKADVLLSTTIVESGLDIPRANTLIVHRADMFGLAQLYQLRGRVGRSKLRAYAYLLTPPNQKLTGGAQQRLKVLQSLDSLGAGFTLASHDLDMRGGGNLLGEEQSGHVKEVGVELYQSMLEDAVAGLRSSDTDVRPDASWSPAIAVGAAVLIPESYVPDLNIRLSLYRRLADLSSDAERDGFAAELIDRFGPMPDEARQLIAVAGLKALCRAAGVQKLDAGPKGAVLTFRDGAVKDAARLLRFVQAHPAHFKLRPDQKLVAMGDWPDLAQRLSGARRALEALAQAQQGHKAA
jgi:transcription-repair coupling factor (superfamily II helicase)